MGKAYSPEQRERVKLLLEAGRDEEFIEKETGVSDRTIRRWKLELERYGRIGKPPESRTGRHRVIAPEIETALFEYAANHPDASVDDLLWWLYDRFKLVVGTRTVRRAFERKGKTHKTFKTGPKKSQQAQDDDDDDDEGDSPPEQSSNAAYQSPYAPMGPPQTSAQHDSQLMQALGSYASHQTPVQAHAESVELDGELPEDEETIQLQLQQIALQKREVELKLKMRRLQHAKGTPGSTRSSITNPSSLKKSHLPAGQLAPPRTPRDSRSKTKIEESKRKTAERQEKMLKDLERRSRRREHLTAEWVGSKDIWPLKAQGLLANLMHQYSCYAYNQNNVDTFEAMYRELYALVDHSKGDWNPYEHDEQLRERMKRKMGQLRAKMVKSGEIIGRGEGYGGWSKAENYTGVEAGADAGEDAQQECDGLNMQAQGGAEQGQQDQLQYEPMPDHAVQRQLEQQMQNAAMAYPGTMMHHVGGAAQYPMMDPHGHPGMAQYDSMGTQQGMVM